MSLEVDPAEQPDGAATEQPDQADPNTMPLEDLARLIERENLPPGMIPDVPEPEPEPEPEPTPEPVAEAPAAEPEPEVDLREVERRLEREQWQARYEKLEQHSGRLAGELGHLKRQLAGTQGYETAPEVSDDKASELSRRLDEFERRSNAEAATRAIAEEFAAIGQRPDLASLKLQDEIQQAAQKYNDRWQEVLKIEEPSQARIAARELASGILMDAIGLRLSKKPAAPATNETRVVDRKLAVSASGSTGARAGARPKAPDPMTMPMSDLKKMIDRLNG